MKITEINFSSLIVSSNHTKTSKKIIIFRIIQNALNEVLGIAFLFNLNNFYYSIDIPVVNSKPAIL